MGAVEGALIILIVIQSIILLIVAIAIVVIFVQIKKAVDRINAILQIGENIAEGVQSATRAGLVNLVGAGVRESLKVLRQKKSSKK
jgi:hypothetical protein